MAIFRRSMRTGGMLADTTLRRLVTISALWRRYGGQIRQLYMLLGVQPFGPNFESQHCRECRDRDYREAIALATATRFEAYVSRSQRDHRAIHIVLAESGVNNHYAGIGSAAYREDARLRQGSYHSRRRPSSTCGCFGPQKVRSPCLNVWAPCY